MRSGLLVALGVFALGLVSLLAVEVRGARQLERHDDMPQATPPAVRSESTLDALAAQVAEQRRTDEQVCLARPLFEPGRRAPAGSQTAGRSPPPLPRLAGVLISAGGRQVIFAGHDGKAAVLREGGRIDGFLVQEISAGQVTMLGPDGLHVLRPSFDPDRRLAATAEPHTAAPPLGGVVPGLPPAPQTDNAPGSAGPVALPNWLSRAILGQPNATQ